MLELSDNILFNVISFLNINEIITLTSLNKQLHQLKPWNFLSQTYNLPDCEDAPPDKPEIGFKKAILKTRYVPENEMQIVWGDDKNYWLRNVDTSEFPKKATYPYVKTCAYVHFVWWFEITGSLKVLNSGTHAAFIRIGKSDPKKGLGKNNFTCSVYTNTNNKVEHIINTSPCKYSVSGFYWIYLGKTDVITPGLVHFVMKDTSDDMNVALTISHVEVVPIAQISDEQEHAMHHGWSFALSPGGAFTPFM